MFDLTLALLLFLFPLAYSPGPGNSFFAALAAQGGFGATLPALAGYHVATAAVTLAIGLGLAGSLVVLGAQGFRLVQWAGALWVLWIAARMWSAPVGGCRVRAARATFTDGAVLLVLNPKAWVIIALMFTQFLPPEPRPHVVGWITLVFTVNNLVAFALWSLAGDALGRVFAAPARARGLNRMFALTLACVAGWMVLG